MVDHNVKRNGGRGCEEVGLRVNNREFCETGPRDIRANVQRNLHGINKPYVLVPAHRLRGNHLYAMHVCAQKMLKSPAGAESVRIGLAVQDDADFVLGRDQAPQALPLFRCAGAVKEIFEDVRSHGHIVRNEPIRVKPVGIRAEIPIQEFRA